MSEAVKTSNRTILWIHPGGLLPVGGGGAARTWALVDSLRASGFRVELLTGDQGQYNAALAERVDRLWIEAPQTPNVHPVSWKSRTRSALRDAYKLVDPDLRGLHRLNALLGRNLAPVEASVLQRNRRPRLEAYAGKVACEDPPAIAIASYAWLAPALDHMPPGTLRLIDTHDIQHARRAAARAGGGDLPHAACSREEEARELNRADVLLAIQPEEAAALASLCPGREVLLAEHAHPVAAYVPSPPESRELLYIGNRYDPNIRGLRVLLDQVLPRVRTVYPDVTLTVCGAVCETVRNPGPGVTLAGRVPDLAPCYLRAAVVLNPVPYGTGLKIKTVEGLAHGRCLVCSEAGTGGLGDPKSLPLIVADPQTDMADRIMEVLDNTRLRHDYEQRARAFANARFCEDVVYGPLLQRLRRHVEERDQGLRRASG